MTTNAQLNKKPLTSLNKAELMALVKQWEQKSRFADAALNKVNKTLESSAMELVRSNDKAYQRGLTHAHSEGYRVAQRIATLASDAGFERFQAEYKAGDRKVQIIGIYWLWINTIAMDIMGSIYKYDNMMTLAHIAFALVSYIGICTWATKRMKRKLPSQISAHSEAQRLVREYSEWHSDAVPTAQPRN